MGGGSYPALVSRSTGLFDDAASLAPDYAAVDWAAGPLGPVEGWSQSLRTAVSICLASRFPILLWWGPELTLLYNEAYRPLIGEKHPSSLGAAGREVFSEVWSSLGPVLEAVRAGRGATYVEDDLMLLERHGFTEECYFTYSVSSIADDDGTEGGIFTAALETTCRVIDRRRLDLLRRLGALADTLDLDEVSSRVLAELRTDGPDLPEVDLLLPGPGGRLLAVEPAGALAGAAVAGEPEPDEVLHLPVALADGSAGVLAVRLSEQLVTDEPYVAFLTSVARAVSAALGPAAAYRAEHRRADAQAQLAHRLEGLVQVARLLGAAQTEQEVLAVVTGRAVKVMSAVGAGLAICEGTDHVRVLTSGLDDVAAELALLPLGTPLPVTHAVRTGEASFFGDLRSTVEVFPLAEGFYRRAGTEAAAHLPLRAEGGVIGVLGLAWDVARPFTEEDRDLAAALAALCAQALDRVRARAAEQTSAAAVARMSETLQRSLLTTPPQPRGLQIAVRYQPAGEQAQVGGDWYDAFVTPDGATALVIGDVTGHDRDAAAAMGQVRNLLRATAYGGPGSPAAVLAALERTLGGLEVATLATVVLAHLDVPTAGAADRHRVLRWSNAGHLPPALLTPDGEVRLLEAGEPDLLLGLDADAPRADSAAQLAEGATLLLYTDGLVERRGEGLEVGLARLLGALAELGSLPLERLCDALLERLVGRGPTAGCDDVALLAVRVHPDDLVVLPAEPESVQRGRRHAVAACVAAGHAAVADTVALLVSEVVTNAVRHGAGPVRLAVAAAPGGVRVEVADDDPGLPQQRAAADEDEGGRGLGLVQALASGWGARSATGGKVVWFEVAGPA